MEKYTVQAGDSLWKISRKFNIDIHELASINGLNTKAEQHIIRPEQVLNLPTKDKFYDTQLDLKLYDLTWRPLKSAKIRLTFDSKTHGYVTDGTGSVAGLLIEDSSKGIKVELQHLNQKDYIVIANHEKLPLGKKTLKISSREMIVKGSTSAEKGTQQSTKQQEKEKAKQRSKGTSKSGADKNTKEKNQPEINKTTRTEGGAPTSVSNIGNVSEGLRLPPEAEQYRDYIIDTAKKYCFQPEGLAALIYAESRWKASASNASGSGAVGLGQFKPKTWLNLCSFPQSKVYAFITKKYSYHSVLYRSGELWGVLENGKEVKIDNNFVLSLRLNFEYNIDMIGLYDRSGITQLRKNLPSVDSLEPDELIKVAYLIHMNGAFGAYDIIMNGKESPGNGEKIPTNDTFQKRLHENLKNSDKEERFHSIDYTYRTAFVAWLIDFIDSIIVPDHYRIKSKEKEFKTKSIINKLNPNYNIKNELPTLKATSPVVTAGSETQQVTMAGNTIEWHNPIDICKIRTHELSSWRSATFGWVRTRANGRSYQHQGLDIEAEPGTPIYAVADGRIAFITDPPRGDYGKQLCIIVQREDLSAEKVHHWTSISEDDNGFYFFYAHLSEISTEFTEGKHVSTGQYLGKTGCTGNARGMTNIVLGAHLHFEVRTMKRVGIGMANRLDPAPLIDGLIHP